LVLPLFIHQLIGRPALRFAFQAGMLCLGAVLVVLVYGWSERQGYVQLNEILEHQLDLYAGGLESELGRHEYLPGIVAMDNDVQALLAAPQQHPRDQRANKRLASLNVRAGALVTFVADPGGTVVAASNWYLADSCIGRNVSALPYFSTALGGQPAHHFARNPTRQTPEFYFAQPVLRDGAVIGVAVVQISLAPLESTWSASVSQSNHDLFLVLDEDDRVILASVPEWRNKRATQLAGVLRSGQEQTGLAGPDPTPASPEPAAPLGKTGTEMARPLRIDLQSGDASYRTGWPVPDPRIRLPLYAAQQRAMPHQGWSLVTLSSASNITFNAMRNAFGAFILLAFIGLLGLFLAQRRRAIASRLRAREALQRAHDELELRIEQRTAELHDMNQELLHEIGERKHAEQVLRASQDNLVHAGRLALLGQMSAGITHEISQPLTALRSLSFNTRLLLQRGELARIEKNLQSIGSLAERMGHLTEQLKSFSRKSPLTLRPHPLADAVQATVLLLDNRIRTEHITLVLEIEPQLRACCDSQRLEQVLINLCANAMDAMREAPVKTLTLRVWRDGDRARVQVADSGGGIPDEVQGRLFEPFFSTKPSGQGLGLGLAISADIVRDFGGTLRATNIPGGAAFELDLQLAEEACHV
jgi:two-component system C4-dicarboxylate transport sensor histidine kinase DctB